MRFLMALAVLIAGALVGAPAHADTSRLFTADAQQTWQTNGVVWALEQVNGVVYVGGNFTAVRPPGAAPGQREVPRDNLAAFDARTGALLPLSHTFASSRNAFGRSRPDVSCDVDWDERVYTCDTIYRIKASPDGSMIYVAGDFTSVDGQPRTKIAAFPTAGAAAGNLPLDTGFAPTGINARVRSIAVGPHVVYAGGLFTQMGRVSRQRLGAMNRLTGAVLPFSASADGEVLAMTLSADGGRLVVGGNFNQLNGTAQHALGAVSPSSGQSTTWAWRGVPRTSYITDMVADRNAVYVSSNGEGTWDGRAAVNPRTGELQWFDSCLGATWALALVGDLLYSGGHAHNCNDTVGGFPEQATDMKNPRYYRLLAQTTRGRSTAIKYWFPSTNGGDPNIPATRSPSKLGPRALATDGRDLWVGGQFTTVNNQPQQGLTRFTVTSASLPPARPAAPTVTYLGGGRMTVTWHGAEDLDDPTVRYELYRNSRLAYRLNGTAKPWETPTFNWTDTGLAEGTEVQYSVRAVDGHGTAGAMSAVRRVTVGRHEEQAPAGDARDGHDWWNPDPWVPDEGGWDDGWW